MPMSAAIMTIPLVTPMTLIVHGSHASRLLGMKDCRTVKSRWLFGALYVRKIPETPRSP
jgi:hypothetical protein